MSAQPTSAMETVSSVERQLREATVLSANPSETQEPAEGDTHTKDLAKMVYEVGVKCMTSLFEK